MYADIHRNYIFEQFEASSFRHLVVQHPTSAIFDDFADYFKYTKITWAIL